MYDLDRADIEKILSSHRPIDSIEIDRAVLELNLEKPEIVAKKFLNGDEFYFKNHLSGKSIMAGGVLIEIFAQAAEILALEAARKIRQIDVEDKVCILGKIEALFLKGIRPGQLTIKAHIAELNRHGAEIKGTVLMDDELAAEIKLEGRLARKEVLDKI